MLATLLEASPCLWHLCTWRGNNWLRGVVKACNAFWQQLLFWGHCLFIYLFFPMSLFHTPLLYIKAARTCWQINHAAPLHVNSICTGSSLEIIFVCNIISKCSVFHIVRCGQYQDILLWKPLISSSCLMSVNKIVCRCTEISVTCSQPLWKHSTHMYIHSTLYTQILCTVFQVSKSWTHTTL